MSSAHRRIHLVGSLPPEIATSAHAALGWQLERAATLPADTDPQWIVRYLRDLNGVPALQPILHGSYQRYDDPIAYRVAPGRQLAPDDLVLGRVAEVEAAMAAHQRLAQGGRVLPPHQLSVPSPLDLSTFVFGVPAALMGLLPSGDTGTVLRAALSHVPLFTAAIADEIR